MSIQCNAERARWTLGAISQNTSRNRIDQHRSTPPRPARRVTRLGGPEQQQQQRATRSGRPRARASRPCQPFAEAAQVPGNLLGQVRRPDDQELRVRQVRPQHDEGVQQRAVVVEPVRRQRLRDRRRCCAAAKRSTIENASAVSAMPTRNHRPKIVENQCGSSDITQSTEANVTVRHVEHEARAADPSLKRSSGQSLAVLLRRPSASAATPGPTRSRSRRPRG